MTTATMIPTADPVLPASSAGRYNPAQEALIAQLGRGAATVAFPDDIGAALRARLEDLLEPIAGVLDRDDPVRITKHRLATVHGCEQHHLVADRAFDWSVPAARGTVAHRAIELSVGWSTRTTPLELVDEAIGRLTGDQLAPAQRFLAGLPGADLADLRSSATDLVTKFLECFPPLRKEWTPVTESRVRVALFDGALVLLGRTDLTLGRIDGRQPRKVIIDFKSGRPALVHREDLRFYALLETCRMGVPPRKLASYYLDSAEAHAEEVTEDLLEAAVRRTADGVVKIVELTRRGRAAVKQPGWACRWCPLVEECPEGQAELDRQAEDGDGSW
jgi:hypothetical protein